MDTLYLLQEEHHKINTATKTTTIERIEKKAIYVLARKIRP